jgi:hypothetical protein
MDVGTSLPTFVVVCVLDGSYSNRGAIRGDKTIGVIIYIYIIYIYLYGNITKKLPVKLPLSQTSSNVMFFHFLFFLLKNRRTRERVEQILPGGGLAPVRWGRRLGKGVGG